jgi:hypothetical protein
VLPRPGNSLPKPKERGRGRESNWVGIAEFHQQKADKKRQTRESKQEKAIRRKKGSKQEANKKVIGMKQTGENK